MTITSFTVAGPDRERVAVLYNGTPGGTAFTPATFGPADPTVTPTLLSGGGGLFTTIDDYQRFVLILAAGGRVGADDLLSPETLHYATGNHLPCNQDIASLARHGLEDNLSGWAMDSDSPPSSTRRRGGY